MRDELAAGGAPRTDAAWSWKSAFAHGWLPPFRSGLSLHTMSRTFLEHAVRRRVIALHNVSVQSAGEVRALCVDETDRRVTGVWLRRRGVAHAPAEARSATLVVDAGGRRSRLPERLKDIGYVPPAETVLAAHLGYASRWVRPAASQARDWRALLLMFSPPRRRPMQARSAPSKTGGGW